MIRSVTLKQRLTVNEWEYIARFKDIGMGGEKMINITLPPMGQERRAQRSLATANAWWAAPSACGGGGGGGGTAAGGAGRGEGCGSASVRFGRIITII